MTYLSGLLSKAVLKARVLLFAYICEFTGGFENTKVIRFVQYIDTYIIYSRFSLRFHPW